MDIEPEPVVSVGFEEKVAQAVKVLAAVPGITEAQASILVHGGFHSLEDLLLAEEQDLARLPEIGENAAGILAAAQAEAQRRTIRVEHPSGV